jgi:hypothetical protein
MTSTRDSNDREPAGDVFPALYLIRARGHLEGSGWSDWFGQMELSVDVAQDETTLCGPVADQAELYGLLSRLRNLTLPLLLVQRIDSAASECNGADEREPQ